MGLRPEQYLCSELTISARFIEVIQGPMSYCHSDVSLSISPQFTTIPTRSRVLVRNFGQSIMGINLWNAKEWAVCADAHSDVLICVIIIVPICLLMCIWISLYILNNTKSIKLRLLQHYYHIIIIIIFCHFFFRLHHILS